MRSAHVDPATVDSGAVGFRLAPRINAAGRLGSSRRGARARADDDPDEARRCRRRARGAESRPPGGRGSDPARRHRGGGRAARAEAATARVRLWNEDWHEGVIGIVASRLAERFHRPVVLIARLATRAGKARDGRSRASTCTAPWPRARVVSNASGVTVPPRGCRSTGASIAAFADAFAAHADADLGPRTCRAIRRRRGRLRARLSRSSWREELERLAPFGLGNPDVTLLVPATRP